MKAKLKNTVADHRQLQQLGYPKREAKRLARKHNRKVAARAAKRLSLRKTMDHDVGRPRDLDAVITLAQYAPDGVPYAGTVSMDPSADGLNRVPRGLDDSGRALHGLTAQRAVSDGTDYWTAMSSVTGVPGYAAMSDIPPTPAQQGVNPAREAQDAAARMFARTAGINWFDAMQWLDHLEARSTMS
jgi:hypothetical protein